MPGKKKRECQITKIREWIETIPEDQKTVICKQWNKDQKDEREKECDWRKENQKSIELKPCLEQAVERVTEYEKDFKDLKGTADVIKKRFDALDDKYGKITPYFTNPPTERPKPVGFALAVEFYQMWKHRWSWETRWQQIRRCECDCALPERKFEDWNEEAFEKELIEAHKRLIWARYQRLLRQNEVWENKKKLKETHDALTSFRGKRHDKFLRIAEEQEP